MLRFVGGSPDVEWKRKRKQWKKEMSRGRRSFPAVYERETCIQQYHITIFTVAFCEAPLPDGWKYPGLPNIEIAINWEPRNGPTDRSCLQRKLLDVDSCVSCEIFHASSDFQVQTLLSAGMIIKRKTSEGSRQTAFPW